MEVKVVHCSKIDPHLWLMEDCCPRFLLPTRTMCPRDPTAEGEELLVSGSVAWRSPCWSHSSQVECDSFASCCSCYCCRPSASLPLPLCLDHFCRLVLWLRQLVLSQLHTASVCEWPLTERQPPSDIIAHLHSLTVCLYLFLILCSSNFTLLWIFFHWHFMRFVDSLKVSLEMVKVFDSWLWSERLRTAPL